MRKDSLELALGAAGAFPGLAALVCMGALLQAEPGADSPFPLVPGTWWEYRESYTERVGDFGSTSDDSTRFEVRGSPSRPFLIQRGGFDPASGPIERGADWLRIGPWTGEEALPLPLEVGRQGPPGEGGPERWTVASEEDVAVPAGNFRALRCDFLTRRSAATLWIAPGVGVVREVYGETGRHPDLERVLVRWGQPGGARTPATRPTVTGRPIAGRMAGSRPEDVQRRAAPGRFR